MIGLRYGTPPIVRATGGLRDTVVDEDAAGRRPRFVFAARTRGRWWMRASASTVTAPPAGGLVTARPGHGGRLRLAILVGSRISAGVSSSDRSAAADCMSRLASGAPG